HGQRLENGLESVEQVEGLTSRGMLIGADDHFLGAAARRNKADAGLDESHVCLGCGMNARPMQANFASAAEGHSLWRDDHGLRGMLESKVGVLKAAHGIVD